MIHNARFGRVHRRQAEVDRYRHYNVPAHPLPRFQAGCVWLRFVQSYWDIDVRSESTMGSESDCWHWHVIIIYYYITTLFLNSLDESSWIKNTTHLPILFSHSLAQSAVSIGCSSQKNGMKTCGTGSDAFFLGSEAMQESVWQIDSCCRTKLICLERD